MLKPLSGIVVLDLTRVLAGPFCSMLLGDLGASVVKIEQPVTGDDSRAFGPFINGESAYAMSLNRNKRSIVLNLKHDAGRQAFRQMARRADVVVENFRPGTMQRFDLGYESLKTLNPRIVYAACSGFGYSGPYSPRPAYDQIVQGMAGLMNITGHPGGPPTRVGTSIGDITAGLFTAVGILAALRYREKSGTGQFVDVAMLDCQVAILENAIARHFVTGEEPEKVGNRHPSLTPFAAFRTSTGYINVAVGNDVLWHRFCLAIGRPELADDVRFSSNALRTSNWLDLEPILRDTFASKSVEAWIEVLEESGIPCGPINGIGQAVSDAQVLARGMIVDLKHPKAGVVKTAGIPIKMSETTLTIDRPAPMLGQHTGEILTEFGFSADAVRLLAEEGVIEGTW